MLPKINNESELLRGDAVLRLVIDNIPTMAWTVRPDGIVDFVNERWLSYTGLSFAEEIAEPTRAVHPEDLPRVMARWVPCMAAGDSFEDELRLRQADGEYRWFLIRTVPLRDDQQNIIKWYGSSIDIEDRKRAEEALEKSRDELRALAAKVQSVREEERSRVAREIHDELGQALTAIKIDLSSLRHALPPEKKEQSASLLRLVDETIQVVRRISTELRPVILDAVGLVAAVQWAAGEFADRTGTKCHLDLPETDVVTDDERSTALFRIFQETLTNIARHASATKVYVRLDQNDGHLTLEVQDNGRGVSEEQLSGCRSLGILGMRERARLLGGELSIAGAPGAGTTVRARIPDAHSKGNT